MKIFVKPAHGLLIVLFYFTVSCYGGQVLIAEKTKTDPVIDGKPDDPAWQTARAVVTSDLTVPGQKTDITLKALRSEDRLFILAVFADADESRMHKPWIWDKNTSSYKPGPQREDRFVIKWNMAASPKTDLSVYADNEYHADIWFWKAHRTDPMEFADDKMQILSRTKTPRTQEVVSRSGQKMYLTRMGDRGTPAYKTILTFKYKGDRLPQYEYQAPKGSRGDIQAKGRWADGFWTIEFARKLDTGNPDDRALAPGQDITFGVSIYEIAARKPDNSIDVPYFGCGDIHEPLTLRIPD